LRQAKKQQKKQKISNPRKGFGCSNQSFPANVCVMPRDFHRIVTDQLHDSRFGNSSIPQQRAGGVAQTMKR
jgi:hypothetical protein